MAVNLGKSTGLPGTSSNPVPPFNPTPSVIPGDGVENLKKYVQARIFESYCDVATLHQLIQYGINSCSLDPKKAEIVVNMELESLSAVNEKVLLAELDALLHRFTDKDKKLDPKERDDALQISARPRPGYKKGLNLDLADRSITEFCRTNRVKIKLGVFRWDVP